MTAAEPVQAHAGQDHLTLSAYLGRVAKAIKAAMPDSCWVVAELTDFNRRANGHVYLDVLESENGKEIAKARVTMFANVANKVLAEWERVTGGLPRAGMRVLIKVRAELSPQYGFSLNATGLDPSYTLGDMQAKLQEIISSLKAKGWYDMQKRLAAPAGFWRIAVVSPAGAAGLADFKRDADQLDAAGICRFAYFSATFQGKEASESIRGALREVHAAHTQAPFDAVAVIRGGGAKADLAWLNDANVAAWICRLPIPVFTGIGHEIDECVLDLVAHRKFDTPSKVIGFIKTSLHSEAANLRADIERGSSLMLKLSAIQQPILERSWGNFSRLVRKLVHTQQQTALQAKGRFEQASQRMLAGEWLSLQKAAGSVSRCSTRLCMSERHKIALASGQGLSAGNSLLARERSRLDLSCALYERTNPMTLLSRGFALVRSPGGEIVTSAQQARAAGTLALAFADGDVTVTVE